MKIRTTTLILVLAVASVAFAHPGMTDRFDGHKCFKKCENWGILYGEYHLHDKDRKPVRIKKPPRLHRSDDPVFIPEGVEGGANTPGAAPAAAAAQKVIVVQEQSILFVNPYLLLLLALLVLLLVLRMDRKRKEQEVDR